MKYFILFIFILSISFSAEIDIKLFDNNQNKSYFAEIEQQILEAQKSKSKNIEIINAEKAHLKRLEEASSQKMSFDEFDLNLLSHENNLADSILKALFYVSEIEVKIKKQNDILRDIQNKLSVLKKRIENIVENDKEFLLSYQLQYAYYRVQKSHIETRLGLFSFNKKKVVNSISDSLKNKIDFSLDKVDNEITKIDENSKKLIQQKTGYEIELEKEIINENDKNKETLEKEIKKLEKLLQDGFFQKIDLLNKKILNTLIDKNGKEYLKLYERVNTILLNLNGELAEIYSEQNILIREIAKKILGNTKIFINTSLFESKSYIEQFKKYFSSTLFVFNEQAITLLSILKALFLITAGFLFGVFYKRWIYKISSKWPNMSQMSLKLTANVGYYLIVFITIMIAMSSLGIDMSSISLIAGALSIGIGFGLQTVVSNFIAGIILMFERTIRIGDIIEISDVLKGTVADIRIRSTTIKTFDNIDIVIPNSSFIQNNVINWTLDDATRRIHISFGVAYGTKIEKVKEVILSELKNSDLTFLRNVKDKEPEIRLENMNTSSVDFELLVWVKANDKFKPNSLKSDFMILIYNALYKHNIEIPFPQLDLHVKKDLKKENDSGRDTSTIL
ncbi:MAG: mechanosensitive ion channel protein MscS [Arcobacter sp.]|nr:MAG: mechanosensitive ion channel protein MscS [Arcobacter sp.]